MLLGKFNIFYCFVYIYMADIYLFAIRMDCLVSLRFRLLRKYIYLEVLPFFLDSFSTPFGSWKRKILLLTFSSCFRV